MSPGRAPAHPRSVGIERVGTELNRHSQTAGGLRPPGLASARPTPYGRSILVNRGIGTGGSRTHRTRRFELRHSACSRTVPLAGDSLRRKGRESNPQGFSLDRFRGGCHHRLACPSLDSWSSHVRLRMGASFVGMDTSGPIPVRTVRDFPRSTTRHFGSPFGELRELGPPDGSGRRPTRGGSGRGSRQPDDRAGPT